MNAVRLWMYRCARECQSPGVLRFQARYMTPNTRRLLERFASTWANRCARTKTLPMTCLAEMAVKDGVPL